MARGNPFERKLFVPPQASLDRAEEIGRKHDASEKVKETAKSLREVGLDAYTPAELRAAVQAAEAAEDAQEAAGMVARAEADKARVEALPESMAVLSGEDEAQQEAVPTREEIAAAVEKRRLEQVLRVQNARFQGEQLKAKKQRELGPAKANLEAAYAEDIAA